MTEGGLYQEVYLEHWGFVTKVAEIFQATQLILYRMLNFCLRFKFSHFLPVHYVCVSTLLLARPALLNLPLCPNQWPQLSLIIVRASVGQCVLVSKLIQKEILRKTSIHCYGSCEMCKKNMKIIHVITSHCLWLTFHCILVTANYIKKKFFFLNTQNTVTRLHIPI